MGAEAVQLFISAPQQWTAPVLTDDQVEAFLIAKAEAGLPVFFHGVYLMNFASQDSAILEKSVTSLAGYMRWANRLGVKGTIFHVGSHLGLGFDAVLPQMCRLLKQALDEAGNESWLILENNAARGTAAPQLSPSSRRDHPRPQQRLASGCASTCHAFAMGYDIPHPPGAMPPWPNSSARSGWTASPLFTPTTARCRWAGRATATKTSATAASATRGSAPSSRTPHSPT
jgi:deoxyribonuclease-4